MGTSSAPNTTSRWRRAEHEVKPRWPVGDLEVSTTSSHPRSLDAIALGTTCDGCHVKGDFAKATKEKEGAERAYNRFVAGLRFGDGTPLFCDSCHQGKWSFLQRTDHDEVATWMKHNFVDKLVKKHGTAISCATCHQK